MAIMYLINRCFQIYNGLFGAQRTIKQCNHNTSNAVTIIINVQKEQQKRKLIFPSIQLPYCTYTYQRWAESHISDSDSTPTPTNSTPTPKIFLISYFDYELFKVWETNSDVKITFHASVIFGFDFIIWYETPTPTNLRKTHFDSTTNPTKNAILRLQVLPISDTYQQEITTQKLFTCKKKNSTQSHETNQYKTLISFQSLIIDKLVQFETML